MIEIEKNVPLKRVTPGQKSPYPFQDMEVGDSFAFPGAYHTAAAHTQIWKHRLPGKRFSLRKMDDGSIRIWRVE